jgi:D-alanyl-lipoteichoic acid acyltransferase DltB (MBOAT superfamily)
VYLYAFQIYFDFSGYTDIARGLALLFGFRWPENFRAPYLATSVRDFWQRWHITLSAFLRDYLYIPLGGSRGGEWQTARNLMATMLLGGLWHGGRWSFLVWGGLHGALLVLHRLWSRGSLAARLRSLPPRAAALWQLCCVLVTFHSVCLAWCFFRVTEWQAALVCVGKCFAFDAGKLLVGDAADLALWLLLGAYAAVAIVGQSPGLPLRELVARLDAKPLARGFAWGFGASLAVLAVVLAPSEARPPFLYFQF